MLTPERRAAAQFQGVQGALPQAGEAGSVDWADEGRGAAGGGACLAAEGSDPALGHRRASREEAQPPEPVGRPQLTAATRAARQGFFPQEPRHASEQLPGQPRAHRRGLGAQLGVESDFTRGQAGPEHPGRGQR